MIGLKRPYSEIFGGLGITYEDSIAGLMYIWFRVLLRDDIYTDSTTK